MRYSTLRATIAVAAWVLGLFAAVQLFFTLGPQLQCAADPECARAGERWWHLPLILGLALGPGGLATLWWWRSRGRAA